LPYFLDTEGEENNAHVLPYFLDTEGEENNAHVLPYFLDTEWGCKLEVIDKR